MADGFGAVAFGVLIRKPYGSSRADYTVQHIPGGNVNYIHIGGALPKEESLAIDFADEAAFNSLEALIGTAATLTVNSVAHSNAVLVSLQKTSNNPVFADAVFIVP